MHALPVLKHAALEAFDTEDGPGDIVGFLSFIDPQSVLDLVEIPETRITDEEVQALHLVIAELGDYIRRTSPAPEALELLRRAKPIVGITTRRQHFQLDTQHTYFYTA
jgi:hypothetical protein